MKTYLCRGIFILSMTTLLNTHISQDIFFIFLAFSLLLLSILKSNYWKHTKLLILGVFSQRYANQLLREDNVFTERINIITLLLMIINFSLIIAKILEVKLFFDLGFIAVSVVLFYVIKKIIMRTFGVILMINNVMKLGVFFSFLFDRVFAIVLYVPLVFLYFFAFDLAIFMTVIIAAFFLFFFGLKIFWLWRIGTKAFGFSHFYIFLYLCILELSPVLLLGNMLFLR